MREYWGSGYSGTGGGGGGGGGAAWLLTGNAGTNPVLNFVGTTDAQDLVLSANSIERVRLIVGASIRFSDSAGNSELFVDDYEALTQSNVRIRASGPIADVALVLSSSGNGPTLANSPDGGLSGGNPRGIYATDFQKARNDKIQVAGGDYSGILAGENNEISPAGTHSSILGGLDHVLDGNRSVIAGGSTNAIRNGSQRGVIGGGASNQIGTIGTVDSATIAGGSGNVVEGDNAFIGGGNSNAIQSGAIVSAVVGGESNSVESTYSFVGGGFQNQILNVADVFSAIVGGTTNTVTDASHSLIGGGLANSLGSAGDTSDYSVLVGGDSNSVVGSYSFLGGGTGNVLGGAGGVTNYASIVGGNTNFIGSGSDYSTVNGGFGNAISPGITHGSIYGGKSNAVTIDGYFGTVLGGYWGSASHYAEAAHSSGVGINGTPIAFIAGGAQHSWVVWRNYATAAVTTELFLDGNEAIIVGSPFRFTLQAVRDTYQFEIQVAARDTVVAGQAAWWKIIGGVYRGAAGTTALIGANTATTQNTGGNSAGWTVAVVANAATDTLRINVTTGASPNPVAFVASGHMTRCCSA
jgi:hypothetical protein